MHLLKVLSEKKLNFEESINLLHDIEIEINNESIFHLLQFKDNLHDSTLPILNSIIAGKGYYPYVEYNLTGPQGLAQEFHKSDHIPFTFHREQRNILTLLNQNNSIVLCAPTSFGKSLLIEEIVASNKYNNIVIIQPTLALLDETRKKLKSYENYRVIYSKSQSSGSRNIYLLTAERFIEFPTEIKVDFFIIDEFYKLDLEGEDRKNILNLTLYKLLQKSNHFYLLGPQVKLDSKAIEENVSCKVIETNFTTVGANVSYVGDQTLENLLDKLKDLDGQSLVYTRSPDSAERISDEISNEIKFENNKHEDFISWCSSNVHPNWSLYSSLRKGIGFHHAQMPRYVGNYVIESFNKGHIKILVCTSTLMEGVNTSAKNVLIYHLNKGLYKLNALDLRNMSGRAGRMKKYFVGNVLIFSKDLKLDEPQINIPSLAPEIASDELIIHMTESSLPQSVKTRLEQIKKNSDLPLEVLKKHAGISIESQINFYNKLMVLTDNEIKMLIWNGYADWDELLNISKLLFSSFTSLRSNLVRTGKEMASYVMMYQRSGNSAAVINYLITSRKEPIDKAIRETFGRIRTCFEFRLPKFLLTAQEIVSIVASKRGIPVQGLDYSFYASALENGFLPSNIGALRELGIPIELLQKLKNRVDLEADPELIIKTLKRLALESDLHPYEVQLIKDL